MTNSREKGKRIERLWAAFLTSFGFPARRGQQFSGGAESHDVVCESLPIAWEVKGRERWSVYGWLDTIRAEAGAGEIPVVAAKKNHGDFVCLIRATDFMEILQFTDTEALAEFRRLEDLRL